MAHAVVDFAKINLARQHRCSTGPTVIFESGMYVKRPWQRVASWRYRVGVVNVQACVDQCRSISQWKTTDGSCWTQSMIVPVTDFSRFVCDPSIQLYQIIYNNIPWESARRRSESPESTVPVTVLLCVN
eukprot:scaffold3763_cov165-Amphora_coffeaeformis.AAC.20